MGENLDNYEITPSDLGQDPENEPGVVEEAIASGETKQPISLCFEKIPFEKRKRYRELYDTLEQKDMSFEDFAVEMCAGESPVLIQQDLARITDQKQQGNRRLAANLHDIKKNLN